MKKYGQLTTNICPCIGMHTHIRQTYAYTSSLCVISFHQIGPLGQFGLVVAMSVRPYPVPSQCNFAKVLKLKWIRCGKFFFLILINSGARNHHYLLLFSYHCLYLINYSYIPTFLHSYIPTFLSASGLNYLSDK